MEIILWYVIGLILSIYITALIDPAFTVGDVLFSVFIGLFGPLLLPYAIYWTWRVRHPYQPYKPKKTLFSLRIPWGSK